MTHGFRSSQGTRTSEPEPIDSIRNAIAFFVRYLELRLQLFGWLLSCLAARKNKIYADRSIPRKKKTRGEGEDRLLHDFWFWLALDLSTRPPRSGLEKLGGFYLLARTIDKIRAHLPDGNPREYEIPGFSQRLSQALGVSEYDLREAVARARNDGDVLNWLQERTDISRAEEGDNLS
jgi:hypothetical protein